MTDRSWMYRLTRNRSRSEEFMTGVKGFLDFSFSKPLYVSGGLIRCPCAKCKNRKFLTRDEVMMHLVKKGFVEKYLNWYAHGEPYVPYEKMVAATSSSSTSHAPLANNAESHKSMAVDATRMDFEYSTQGFNQMSMEEEPNVDAARFYQLLEDANKPLWDGCTTQTKLSAMAGLLNIKAEHGTSEACYDQIIDWAKSILPEGNQLKDNFCSAMTMMEPLGLSYDEIDICPNFCTLYNGIDSDDLICKVCSHPRYKPTHSARSKLVAYKKIRYFPITPRLQRLFMSSKTAEHMTWHHSHRIKEGLMEHPSDGQAWKHFNIMHPEFSTDPRNVRLGVYANGFNPLGKSFAPYSCWSVMTTIYNLPPEMCMKREFMFMNMLIPGPCNPSSNIDVCLRPLIDELKQLWSVGAATYDVCKKQNFQMKAALLWTINDFSAYEMLSGWSTNGKLACPYCMQHTKAFISKNGGKASFFDCHRRFLPMNHKYRSNIIDFCKGKIEKDHTPPFLSGEDLLNEVWKCGDIVFGFKSNEKSSVGFDETHNWVKRSIFWELPYWHTNLIRHNIDVMSIEKSVFGNIFNTVMDVKGKTKDNLKARLDLPLYCDRKNLELQFNGTHVSKPQATFSLEKDAQNLVLQWLKSLRFPDDYGSNISRRVDMEEGKLYGMKSNDSHVFMQRLIPIAFRDLLPKGIWDALTEMSHFFRDLCSHTLSIEHVQKLEKNIVETICKLEMIFPPTFLDSIQHLPIHLAYEAKIGGPVHYRWIHPFERYLYNLKKKVGYKDDIEGSLCEVYIIEEISLFTSFYFEPRVQTTLSHVPRNDDCEELGNDGRLSIFSLPGCPTTKTEPGTRFLTDLEFRVAHLYVLFNCKEVEPFIEKHYQITVSQNPNASEDQLEQLHEQQFAIWFRDHVHKMGTVASSLKYIAAGPARSVKCYNSYFVNGYVFHTEAYDQHRKTYNSGVCVKGSTYNEHEDDYYGKLEEIVELDYHAEQNKVVLFKCHWYDTKKGVRVDPHHGLVEVKRNSRLPEEDVFVLAQQCQQIYFTYSPSFKTKDLNTAEWLSIIKVKARSGVEDLENDDGEGQVKDDAYQMDELLVPYEVAPSTDLEDPFFRVVENSFNEVDYDELLTLGEQVDGNLDEDENEDEEDEDDDELIEEDEDDSD